MYRRFPINLPTSLDTTVYESVCVWGGVTLSIRLLGAVHMSRASPANRADLSHENLYFSTT